MNLEFEALYIGNFNDNVQINCLLYMDDLKLLAQDEATLSNCSWKTENFFAEIEFSLHVLKLARAICYEELALKIEKCLVVNPVMTTTAWIFFKSKK